MKAPFPYFGGKSTVASVVWNALGQPVHYMEPFFGSGAVLLARPNYDNTKHTETICDKDGFVANVWRSIQFSPDETAKWCDWPVNHADLIARRSELIRNEDRLLDNLTKTPTWHDPVMAGYWIWAASCWIGAGLTTAKAIPSISTAGKGVCKKTLQCKRPHLGDDGIGVHKKLNHNKIYELFNELSNRLRRVRVVCGSWTRICGGNWQDKMGSVGMFFDPPYGVKADRQNSIYAQDSLSVAQDVQNWCLERGNLKTHKICLAGYYEEHKNLLKEGWTEHKWKAAGGYGNTSSKATKGKENSKKETLFFSPHCVNQKQMTLF